jgi:uncharacterized membrane protein
MVHRIERSPDEPTAIPAPRAMTFARAIARRPLRRLTVELALVIVVKLAFLMLIWWLIFAPHPKPDASADAIARRLAPSTNPPEAHP